MRTTAPMPGRARKCGKTCRSFQEANGVWRDSRGPEIIGSDASGGQALSRAAPCTVECGDPRQHNAQSGVRVSDWFFTSDLHGQSALYEQTLALAAVRLPAVVILGGDLAPHHAGDEGVRR